MEAMNPKYFFEGRECGGGVLKIPPSQLQHRGEGLKVRVPPDMLPVLQAWAERSGCTVEQVVRELLARALQVPGGGN